MRLLSNFNHIDSQLLEPVHGDKSFFLGKAHESNELLESWDLLNEIRHLDHLCHGDCLELISKQRDVNQEKLRIMQISGIEVDSLHLPVNQLDTHSVVLVGFSPLVSGLWFPRFLFRHEFTFFFHKGFGIFESHGFLHIPVGCIFVILEILLVNSEKSFQLWFHAWSRKFVQSVSFERKVWSHWVNSEHISRLGSLLNGGWDYSPLLSLSLDVPVSGIFECSKQMLAVLLHWHGCFRSTS